ncbi:acyltransferase ChoActase/COT/CPT [Chytridium lagenaria]|nr:acyltransferase ChoActase/COT/CPT [Chytridium lagenaria]
MDQYKKLFGSLRIPGGEPYTRFPSDGNHIIVMAKENAYKVSVYKSDGSRLGLKDLERVLYAITKESLKTMSDTASKNLRNSIYSKLIKLNEENVRLLEEVKSALFVLCLDDISSKREFHKQVFHHFDGRNRWFDKSLQLIVSSDGQAGFNGDALSIDASVAGRVADTILSREPYKARDIESTAEITPPEKLNWVVNEEITTLLKKASKDVKEFNDDLESISFDFEIYGTRFLNEVAKSDPDAFFQNALLLTWRRLQGSPISAAEYLGVVRTSRDNWEFATTFDDDNILYDDKRALYSSAASSQATDYIDVASGLGMDGHLKALSKLVNNGEEGTSKLFESKAFKALTSLSLLSRHMPQAANFSHGFSPVTRKGYGIVYNLQKDKIIATLTSRKSSSANSFKFRDTLERTLKDLMILFPKRSEIWGKGWRQQHEQERKNEYYLRTMRQLSDQYIAKRAHLARKYNRN